MASRTQRFRLSLSGLSADGLFRLCVTESPVNSLDEFGVSERRRLGGKHMRADSQKQANQAVPGNGATAIRFQIQHLRRAVPEHIVTRQCAFRETHRIILPEARAQAETGIAAYGHVDTDIGREHRRPGCGGLAAADSSVWPTDELAWRFCFPALRHCFRLRPDIAVRRHFPRHHPAQSRHTPDCGVRHLARRRCRDCRVHLLADSSV